MLITLAIIGIVAALTLTTVVPEIQLRQNIAKWKECYSILNNAFNLAVAEDPKILLKYDWFMSKEYINAFWKNLQIVDKCSIVSYHDIGLCDNYSSWSEKDIHYKWSGIANGGSGKYKTLAGGSYQPYDAQVAALLNNGASVYWGAANSGFTILVDVNNCTSGPNTLGKDIYAIWLGSNDTKTQYIGDLTFKPQGAIGTSAFRNNNGGCDINIGKKDDIYIYSASGAGCSYKYLMK